MLKFSKVRTVKDPSRGTSHSAGLDFYVPEFTPEFIKDLQIKNDGKSVYFIMEDLKKIQLPAHERILIPSGIHMNLTYIGNDVNSIFLSNSGIALIAHNKSGIGTKKGLDRLAEVVDEDYQGEIHISIVNTSNRIIEIFEDEKLIQFLAIPVLYPNVEEVFIEDLYDEETDRGADGFGKATGNK